MQVFIDVLYTGLATVCVMAILQVLMFAGIKLLYPPPPRIIYRDIPVMPAPPRVVAPPVLTEPPPQDIKLPEYEPRQQASDSLRLDPQLPIGIKETRPPGT
jgi:hypothetical protein